MKFYSVSSGTVNHMLSGCNGRELELPFELTSQEMKIVNFNRSSFVLGRSGTGKTTILIRKLLQREQLSHIASEGFHEPLHGCSENALKEQTFVRQIFVTHNPRLCYAVKEQYAALKRFVTGCKASEDYTSVQLDDLEDLSQCGDIPDSFVNLDYKLYPLSITFNKFLMMLDGTIGNSFFDRFAQARKICAHGSSRSSKSIALKTFIRMNQVTFQKFRVSYWPHFDQKSTKSLEVSTVFTEIMSHIKGGIHENLGAENYISLRRSRASNLNENETEQIYRIFLQYEKRKEINGEYDTADLVTDLHRRFRETSYEGDILDFVYVDEVQDLSMSQIALFKHICKNIGDGFFFAGDTAQTIAKGIDFRFEDIRCLFYKEFLKKERGEKGLVSDLFQLNQNFRSHDRILKLAQSITNLIYYFFPQSIDTLDHEIGHIEGETPKILQSSNGKKALASMFSNDGESGKNLVGFGADQVILVRDDEARNEVTSYIGKHSLILTIPECKGLEFQDVLLYNFLSSSPIGSRWNVIYEYNGKKKPDATFPNFNMAKHRLLCSELKQLYVAITRTKSRLWIFETDDKLFEPMFEYWKKMNYVEFREIDQTFASGFKVSGSDYQWKSRGIELFNQQKYEVARMCFDKAGEEVLKKWAEAAELRANAYHIRSSNSILAKINLNNAANIFISIGKFVNAAECFYESEEYERAGEIYFRKCGYSKLEEAGECFARAGFHDRAALSFARGKYFSDCLDSCIEGKLFDEGLNYIEEWKEHLALNSSSDRENSRMRAAKQKLLEIAAMHYKKLRDTTTMMRFVKSFNTRDSMRTFLRSGDCLDELLQLEIEWESFRNAASLAKQMGRMLQEVDLLEKGKYFREASSAILSHGLHSSLWNEGWPLKPFAGSEKLLARAKQLAQNVSNKFFHIVDLEAQILSGRPLSLKCLVTLFDGFQKHSILRGEILSARKILDAHIHTSVDEYLETDLGRGGKAVLSKNKVSVETLIFFYNFWKSKIEKVFMYLDSRTSYEDYGEFCLYYLGAIMADNSSNEKTKFILLNPDACWAKQINESHRLHKGDLVLCKAKQFVHAARCYWSLEMISVGKKVFEKFETLLELWRQHSLPLHCQVAPLLNMFKVAKSLNESKFLHTKNNDEIRIHSRLQISSSNFFEDLFPVDWRERVTLDVIELRKSEKFRSLLEQLVLEIWSMKSQTCEKFFKFSVIAAFDSKRLEEETGGKISSHFWDYQFIRTFLESLMKSRPALDSMSRVKTLLISFERSIGEIGFCVSPCLSVYLLEHVLISTFVLKGHFFWTSSSFLDWFVGKEKDWNKMVFLERESDWEAHFGCALESVAMIIYNLLSGKTLFCIEFHKVVLLRLFVALSLICLNTGNYYTFLSELLDKEDTVSQLHPEFSKFVEMLKFESRTSEKISKVRVLAKAFGQIGNPMVIVSSGKSFVEFDQLSNAFFFDLEADGEIIYD